MSEDLSSDPDTLKMKKDKAPKPRPKLETK